MSHVHPSPRNQRQVSVAMHCNEGECKMKDLSEKCEIPISFFFSNKPQLVNAKSKIHIGSDWGLLVFRVYM